MSELMIRRFCGTALTGLVVSAGAAAAPTLQFNRDILPILSDACLHCHGPDSGSRKAGLRLDREEFAFAEREGGPVIVRGNPDKSLLVERLLTTDPEEVMPPADSHKSITPEQRDTLVEWVRQGAPWEEHWAFIAPERVAPPANAHSLWNGHPVDQFLFAAMKAHDLKPNPPADSYTLFRRLNLDLTGLPPSAEAAKRFASNPSPQAYEKWVDQLMDTRAYAEHMARYWLDAARYGDTHGYHLDNLRIIWPYRDWVVGAFEENMPFDQFTIEQIAGDLLPSPTLEQRIATGFHRCLVTTSEGGAIGEEYNVKYGVDRAQTTGQVWLGLTMECASCHDHKYDPISQKDFYSMFAFFNNTTMPPMDGNKKDTPPVIQVPLLQDRAELESLPASLASQKKIIRELRKDAAKRFDHWNATREVETIAAVHPLPKPTFHALLAEGSGTHIGEEIRNTSVPLKDPGATIWVHSPRDTSFSADGMADSPDEIKDDGGSTGPKAAIDGNPATYWDEQDKQKAYVFTLTFPEERAFGRIQIQGFKHHDYAPKDFDILLDGTVAHTVKGAVYANNIFEVDLPEGSTGKELRLDITGYYGQSPAIREIEVYAPDGGRYNEQALALNGKRFASFGSVGDFEHTDSFTWGAWLFSQNGKGSGPVFSRMDGKNGHRGWDLYLAGNKLMVHLINAWPNNALRAEVIMPANRWTHVMVTYDGTSKGTGLTAWIDGEAQPMTATHDSLNGSIRTKAPFLVGSRHQSTPGRQALVRDIRVYDGILPKETIAAVRNDAVLDTLLATKTHKPHQRLALLNWYTHHEDSEVAEAEKTLSQLEKKRTAILARGTTTFVMQERPNMTPKAFILKRGAYDARGERVTPNVPEVFGGLPKGAPTNRLGLAQWLVSGDNPLTARVTVNRFWQQLFGRGLVSTAGDFGLQGSRPTHPELLDWLAIAFVESGWDTKALMKSMVLSHAYRQSPVVSKEALSKDSDNLWLARGARYRLDAEVIRDQILSSSGIMVESKGGEPVKPYQPGGIWSAVAYSGSNTKTFKRDTGDKLYRRSLYTFWKRTAPPAQLAVFDAPSRESCTVQRERTNTPLQALALMNDVQYIEASRYLASHLLSQQGSDTEHLDQLTRRILGRPMDKTTEQVLEKYLHAFRTHYTTNESDAMALVQAGESEPPDDIDASELAAWTLLASKLYNLDEFVSKN